MSRKKKKARAPEGRAANRRVVMTEAERLIPARTVRSAVNLVRAGRTIATGDPCDRAHDVRGRDGLLVSGALLPGHATPRRYPPAYMHAVIESGVREGFTDGGDVVCETVDREIGVVSDETVFDRTYELQHELMRLGLDVNGRGTVGEEVREEVRRHPRLRDLVGRRGGK